MELNDLIERMIENPEAVIGLTENMTWIEGTEDPAGTVWRASFRRQEEFIPGRTWPDELRASDGGENWDVIEDWLRGKADPDFRDYLRTGIKKAIRTALEKALFEIMRDKRINADIYRGDIYDAEGIGDYVGPDAKDIVEEVPPYPTWTRMLEVMDEHVAEDKANAEKENKSEE